MPAAAPFDLWNRESPKGVKLYVQRVFITDQATQFLPLYLRFVRGVVDSSELALNVSRELLQQDEAIGAMRTALTRRVLDMLERLAEDAEKYAKFWGEFGALLKEGLVEDFANRDRLAKLMRFSTTKTTGSEQARSLKDYLERRQAGAAGDLLSHCRVADGRAEQPALEAFKERGIEVLLLTDRLDEWVMQHLTEYDGKPCKDVRRGALDLPRDGRRRDQGEARRPRTPGVAEAREAGAARARRRGSSRRPIAAVGRVPRAQRARPRLSDARAARRPPATKRPRRFRASS